MQGGKAVVFGAGKIGCGLLGQILAHSGYEILFVARRPEIISAINRRHGYSLAIASEPPQVLAVESCSALSITDRRVADKVATADIVFTAVGIGNLSAITSGIADGLYQRSRARAGVPLNVIACENLPGAGNYLSHQVISAAPIEHAIAVEEIGGFSAATTHRIITKCELENSELVVTVDPNYDLIIDVHGWRGNFPDIEGVIFTEEFPVRVMRKLFTLNCAHAVAAYLGYRQKCRYVHEAAAHPEIEPVLRGAVAEAQATLKAEFPHEAKAIDRDGREALERIANPRLADTISRVACGPRRKLSSRERLVGPARLASQHHLPHDNLCLAIAAALTYAAPDDQEAANLQKAIVSEGVDKILTEDCGLLPHEELAHAVKRQWLRLVTNGAEGRGIVDGVGSPLWTHGSFDEIFNRVATDLSRRYDADLVRDVLARVVDEFREARVLNYVPVLMKRKAIEHIRRY